MKDHTGTRRKDGLKSSGLFGLLLPGGKNGQSKILVDALRKANKTYQMEILGKGGESTHLSLQAPGGLAVHVLV